MINKWVSLKNLTLILAILLASTELYPCTIIAVGKKVSADGSVIISHTDCGADNRIRVVHGRSYKNGEMAPVYFGIQDIHRPLDDYGDVLGHIPQVEKTYTYFHSAYPHMNEHQLAIAESTTSQRKELKVDIAVCKQIMTVEQAQAFALQRYTSAREATAFIGQLMSQYGFLPSCVGESETLVVGDTEEIWIIDIFSVGSGWDPESGEPGAIWVAQRVPDDHALVVANWSIIKEVDENDPENFIFSPNYKQFAIDKGWFNPEGSKPFILQEVYAPMFREWAANRMWLFYSTYAPGYAEWPERKLEDGHMMGYNQYIQYVEPLSIYPTSVKPERKISIQDVMAFQRSTFEGTIYDKTEDYDWYVPDGEGGIKKSPLATPFPSKDMRELLDINNRRNVARPQGFYGMIAQLRGWLPDPIGGIYWVFLDNAYTSPYVPIYAGTQETADCYKNFDPTTYSNKSACWAIDFVDNLLYLKWQDAVQDLWKVRDPYEKQLFSERDHVDQEALALYKKNPDKALEYLTAYSKGKMETVLDMYNGLHDTLIVKYSNSR
ncbi:MAG: peptidase [Bacteroidetes bacterium]|nr:MAG: peptidase [Bacteroidota bacterium]RLD88884.1 MAG: peptidase [Bacteroidota bacterium]